VALHRKELPDAPFLERLPLIEAGATDPRNFVKKGVNWALRAIGSRKSPALKTAALEVAARLAAMADPTARWNGKDALRQLTKKTG
jgi:3-methyladenine DNA glycosylase AlkD